MNFWYNDDVAGENEESSHLESGTTCKIIKGIKVSNGRKLILKKESLLRNNALKIKNKNTIKDKVSNIDNGRIVMLP